MCYRALSVVEHSAHPSESVWWLQSTRPTNCLIPPPGEIVWSGYTASGVGPQLSFISGPCSPPSVAKVVTVGISFKDDIGTPRFLRT
jgi:hypothetical protein